jgi:hypothetical protein
VPPVVVVVKAALTGVARAVTESSLAETAPDTASEVAAATPSVGVVNDGDISGALRAKSEVRLVTCDSAILALRPPAVPVVFWFKVATRAAARVPDVMFVALVVSVVAEAAKPVTLATAILDLETVPSVAMVRGPAVP